MYIAFKWLFGLTFVMWITMCCLDTFTRKHSLQSGQTVKIEPFKMNNIINMSPMKSKINLRKEKLMHSVKKHNSMVYMHCLMFVAGALAVIVFNRIDEVVFIFMSTKRKLANVVTNENTILLQKYFKFTATAIKCYSLLLYCDIRAKFKQIVNNLSATVCRKMYMKMFQRPRVDLMLLEKLKEVNEEKRNLAQQLIAALQENRNVRSQYQLENMAKKRFVKHVETTENLIKENRSRYVSFQQLYLVTHQENAFLKCRLKKLTMDKEEVERDLLQLLNEVFKSKNKELKTFCSRFIVRTKHSLLNYDANMEVQKFMNKSRGSVTSCSSQQLYEQPDIRVEKANSWLKCANHSQITQFIKYNNLVAPKLRGLPGEYVWTVKDKDGLIEKLYECDYETGCDAGDTIRRIREYSVYHDKDCLLDMSNSSTIITEKRVQPRMESPQYTVKTDSITNERFLTGSEAFRNFMQSNENVFSLSLLPKPRLLSN